MKPERKRIMIIGQPGSGKSTLARTLADVLDLPAVHIDRIHWQSGWIERKGPDKDSLCAEIHARDTWIFEGGRAVTWPERLDRADTLIWLDFPLYVRAWRVLKRRVEYHGTTRPDLPSNCPERLSWEFIRFIWRTRNTSRLRMKQLFYSAPIEKEKYRLCNRHRVAEFIHTIK